METGRGEWVFSKLQGSGLFYDANLEKTQKIVRSKGWLGLILGSRIFCPSPIKPLPIVAAAHGLQSAEAVDCWVFTRPSHPVQQVERHGLRRPLSLVHQHLTSLSTHRNEKGRTHMRIH